MRQVVDIVQIAGHSSARAGIARERLDQVRVEFSRVGPSSVMVLGSVASCAFERYRAIAEPALQLDSANKDRWLREREAIEAAIAELIKVGRIELRLP